MKFAYSGPYKEFRGYVFIKDKPVTVSDRGTQEALSKMEDFRRVDEEEETEAPLLDPQACPKCGKVVKRGRHFHVRSCKGATP